MKLNKHQTGLALGSMMALAHTLWATMVFLGVVQLYMDWILMLHSLNNPFKVLPFDLLTSLALIVATFVIGYAFGWVFAAVWEKITKK